MEVLIGSIRVVLVFDNFVVKIPRVYHWINRSIILSFHKSKNRDFRLRIIEYYDFFKVLFSPIKKNWSEFMFYQKTRHKFCAKTYFSLFGLFNIQERVIYLNGSDVKTPYVFPRIKEYHYILKGIFSGREKEVESHTFFNPNNFGFSKRRYEFVCLDYEDSQVQSNILEFGDRLQEVFRDFDKTIKPLE